MWDASVTEKWGTILNPAILSSLSFLVLSVPLDKMTENIPQAEAWTRFLHPFMSKSFYTLTLLATVAGMSLAGVQDYNLITYSALAVSIAGYHRFRDIGLNTLSLVTAAMVLQSYDDQIDSLNRGGNVLYFSPARNVTPWQCHWLGFGLSKSQFRFNSMGKSVRK
jgi:hypothetical protein